MGRRSSLILCAIGVLVITSVVKAQDPSGTPGVDYPNYFTLPETSFKCSDQQYNPGFYADTETKCQAFHFCYQDRMESFLCPTGTIFNQAVLTCDVWYKSNCSLARMFYSVNAGPVMERAGKNLPMLLRLRNRSQAKSPVQTSASVSDEESIVHKNDNETPSEVSFIPEGNELKVETDKPIDSSLKDLDNENNEQMVLDSSEDFNSEKDAGETQFTNDIDEEMDASFVYDGVNDGYYKQYDNEWQDTEPESRDFKNFYDYREQHEYQNYPDFTKRSSQTGRTRVRRKPVYVDQPVMKAEEMAETKSFEFDISNRGLRKGKEMNLGFEYTETEAPSPTPFPRPTRIPSHQLNIPTSTPMSSEAFEQAILSEIAFPDSSDWDGEEVITLDHQSDQGYSQSDIANGGLREGKEMNLGFEYTETETPSPTPFPRPTRIPSHQLNIPTSTPMSSEAFEHAILSEIAFPDRSEWNGEEVITLDHQQSDQGYSHYEETYNQSPDIQRDEDIYIENDIEHDSYVPYNSQHDAVVPESGEEAYSDTEDTFVIIPDEYDDAADLDLQDYPEDTEYRTQILADQSLVPRYDAYDSYRYSSNEHYPQYYEQANYPEQTYQMRENYMPYERYAYESYEFPSQSMNYENSNFDTEEAYTETELHPYGQTRLSVAEEPVPLPVTESDLVNFSSDFDEVADSEQDVIEFDSEPSQPEDVYYVLDFDEDQSNQGNETRTSKIDEKMQLQEPVAVKSEQVKGQNSEVEQLHSSNESAVRNESSDNENERSEKLTKTDTSSWPSNSLSTSDNEHVKPENMKSDINTDSNILADPNLKYASQHVPPVHENLASTNTPYSSNTGSFDFSSDSRFYNGMGYSESMDFGPYGFGPHMGQQFNMMESMQSQAASPFSQRISPAEQPKLSSLSAIQEKMRSMKQGKFGAFKKYMSSTGQ